MEVQLTQAVVIFTGFQKGENEGSQVLETIKSLQGVPVTTADLLVTFLSSQSNVSQFQKTKAGLELKKLVKSENGEVKEAATQLQAYWVELIEAEKPQKRKREGQDSTPSKKVAGKKKENFFQRNSRKKETKEGKRKDEERRGKSKEEIKKKKQRKQQKK